MEWNDLKMLEKYILTSNAREIYSAAEGQTRFQLTFLHYITAYSTFLRAQGVCKI